MSQFRDSRLTLYGSQRRENAQPGERFLFTRIGLGEGLLPEDLTGVTELAGEKQRFAIVNNEVSGGNLWASCIPVGIEDPAGISMRSIGLYIADPENIFDRSLDKLYCVSTAIGGAVVHIPASTSNWLFHYEFAIHTVAPSFAVIDFLSVGIGAATDVSLGLVRSSSAVGQIRVDQLTGRMNANGMSQIRAMMPGGQFRRASLTHVGVTQLSNSYNTNIENMAATSAAVNGLRLHILGLLAA